MDTTSTTQETAYMPIAKETSTRLVKFGYNFEAIPRQVVEQITNPVALAYYAYLLTRPGDWVVRRSQLMQHFGIGRDRHDAAMRQLKEVGVAWVQSDRGKDGKFGDQKLMVGAIPVDDLPSPEVGKPAIREKPPTGKPAKRENTPLKDIQIVKDIQTTKDIQIAGWPEWLEYRAEIKKKMTPATVKKQVALLGKHPPEIQQAIINQSITQGWTGLFELNPKDMPKQSIMEKANQNTLDYISRNYPSGAIAHDK